MKNIFKIFILLFFFTSCSQNNEAVFINKASKNNAIFLKKFSISSFSGDNYPKNILTKAQNKMWSSKSSGKDEIIYFEFYEEIYVKKISISSFLDINFSQIINVSIYTNKGILGNSDISKEILINDSIKFLVIKINAIKEFQFVNAYNDNTNYKLDLQNNKKVAISNISFYDKDNNIMQFGLLPKNKDKKKQQNISQFFIDNKYIDYTTKQKSIILNSDYTFTATLKDNNTEFIYIGQWLKSENKKDIKLYGEKFIFTENSFQKEIFNDKLFLYKNIFESSDLGAIYFDFPDDAFVELKNLDSTIVLDIKYATTDNFTKKILYDCPKCLLRYGVAKDLVKANAIFKKDGFRIKVFDGYRPNSVQYLMWEVVPNKNFVAPPQKGSIHNRGGAVDLTLVDANGKELDMGTEFDFFGIEAFSDNFNHSDTIIANRYYMRNILEQCNFRGIKTEWWHFSHRTCMRYPISDFPLPCEN